LRCLSSPSSKLQTTSAMSPSRSSSGFAEQVVVGVRQVGVEGATGFGVHLRGRTARDLADADVLLVALRKAKQRRHGAGVADVAEGHRRVEAQRLVAALEQLDQGQSRVAANRLAREDRVDLRARLVGVAEGVDEERHSERTVVARQREVGLAARRGVAADGVFDERLDGRSIAAHGLASDRRAAQQRAGDLLVLATLGEHVGPDALLRALPQLERLLVGGVGVESLAEGLESFGVLALLEQTDTLLESVLRILRLDQTRGQKRGGGVSEEASNETVQHRSGLLNSASAALRKAQTLESTCSRESGSMGLRSGTGRRRGSRKPRVPNPSEKEAWGADPRSRTV
jgi:hypothetical protein